MVDQKLERLSTDNKPERRPDTALDHYRHAEWLQCSGAILHWQMQRTCLAYFGNMHIGKFAAPDTHVRYLKTSIVTHPTPPPDATAQCRLLVGWLCRFLLHELRLRSSRSSGRLCVHGFDSTVVLECGGKPSLAVECLDSCDVRCMTDCDWARSSHLLAQQVLEFSSCCRYLPAT